MLERPKRVIAILGMHRSGTSCLTGSLQAGGLELGKFYADNPHNKKGNRENQDVIDLHEELLAYNSASWHQPVNQCNWSKEHIQKAKNIITRYKDIPIWGFKDPRTLLAIGGWRKLLPDIKRVGIFRHPEAVARSLMARNNFTFEQGLELWYIYNTILVREFKRDPFPILCFDLPEDEFLVEVERLIKHLKLEYVERSDTFFSDELRTHSSFDKSKLSSKVKNLYKQLGSFSW